MLTFGYFYHFGAKIQMFLDKVEQQTKKIQMRHFIWFSNIVNSYMHADNLIFWMKY